MDEPLIKEIPSDTPIVTAPAVAKPTKTTRKKNPVKNTDGTKKARTKKPKKTLATESTEPAPAPAPDNNANPIWNTLQAIGTTIGATANAISMEPSTAPPSQPNPITVPNVPTDAETTTNLTEPHATTSKGSKHKSSKPKADDMGSIDQLLSTDQLQNRQKNPLP